jgi:hypothetical protein
MGLGSALAHAQREAKGLLVNERRAPPDPRRCGTTSTIRARPHLGNNSAADEVKFFDSGINVLVRREPCEAPNPSG